MMTRLPDFNARQKVTFTTSKTHNFPNFCPLHHHKQNSITIILWSYIWRRHLHYHRRIRLIASWQNATWTNALVKQRMFTATITKQACWQIYPVYAANSRKTSGTFPELRSRFRKKPQSKKNSFTSLCEIILLSKLVHCFIHLLYSARYFCLLTYQTDALQF